MAKVKVRNRNGGNVFYRLPDEGITRTFTAGEVKEIEEEELQRLQFVPGGEYLLKNALVIESEKVLDDLNLKVEPEYSYTEEDIHRVLFEGTVDEVDDMLNFAPQGVIEIAQRMAVNEEIPDTRKRKLFLDITNFNVDTAISVKQMSELSNTPNTSYDGKSGKQRKAPGPKPAHSDNAVRGINAVGETQRKAAPKYKVIEKG